MAITANLAQTKIEVGQANKETTLNEMMDLFDAAIGGKLTKSVAGSANVTLTSTEARNIVMEFTGVLTGNINVDVPAVGRNRFFIVYNNTTGAFTLTFRYAGGTGVVVGQSKRRVLYHDGTNMVEAITEAGIIIPRVRVYHSVNQSLGSGVTTQQIVFNTEDYDDGIFGTSQHDTSTNTSRLTCRVSGYYRVFGAVRFDVNSTGYRLCTLYKNGAAVQSLFRLTAPAVEDFVASFSTELLLAANDYLELFPVQNSGVSLNIVGGAGQTSFGMSLITQ